MSRSVLLGTCVLAACLLAASPVPGQIASGHYVVASRLSTGGTGLFDVDPTSGAVRQLPPTSLHAFPPLAVTWDPIARHAIVAVWTRQGSILARVDPAGVYERVLGILTDRVVALELGPSGDLFALTGGPTGAVWELPRNGRTARHLFSTPHATALGFDKRSAFGWIAQAPPGAAPTLMLLDPLLGNVLVAPTPIAGLAGATITGVFELPTGAIRHVLTDDQGRIHLYEFFTTLRTLALVPPLPAGATTDLIVRSSATIDAIVLGDGRHPHVSSVPVFGGAPNVTRLCGPIAGSPVDMDLVDSAWWGGFGADCPRGYGAKSLLLPLGGTGRFVVWNAPHGAPALAAFGVSEQRVGGGELPFALPGGCPLLVSAEVVVALTIDSTGHGVVQFPVPPTLPRGLALHAQWLFPTATSVGSSVALTRNFEP